MNATIPTQPSAANGDVPGALATPPMDVLDAAYHLAHAYKGGVPALAQRMGMSANTLQHKLNLNNGTHHLSLREARDMTALSGDLRILHALAGGEDCVVIKVADAPSAMPPVQRVMNLVHEFSGVLEAVNTAMADGRVTPNELAECERHIAAEMAALNGMLATLRTMMPKPPLQFPNLRGAA